MKRGNADKPRRSKPLTPKAGWTKDPKRRYCRGGKLFKCGGKLKK